MDTPISVVQRWYEVSDGRDAGGLAQLVTVDCVLEGPDIRATGQDEIAAWMQAFFSAFPDIRHLVTTMVEANGAVAVELHVVGNHSGALAGPHGFLPPTGKNIDLRASNFFTVSDGRINRVHLYFDQSEFFAQLGLLPG